MTALSRLLVRGRWAVVLIWGVVALAAAWQARRVEEALAIDGGSNRVTEASRAAQLLATRFPSPLNDFFAVTLKGPASFREGRGQLVLDSLAHDVQRLPWVSSVVWYTPTKDSAFISRDGTRTFLIVAIVPHAERLAKPRPVTALRQRLRATLENFAERAQLETLVTGRSALDYDVRTISAEDSRRSELRLFPLTLVILVLAFGALVAALLPLVVGFLAITISLAAITLIAKLMPMSIFVLNMTTMIGLGVGIDYSLLVVTRFREELSKGRNRMDAAVTTMRTAGVAVITSGLTVVVGFAALLFTPLVETRSVGVGGLVVVAVAVVLSVTLLPAMLALLGRGIDRPRWLATRLAWYHSPTIWERWARSLARHPWRAMAIGGGLIALLTAPALRIRIGLPARDWWPTQTEAGKGVQRLSEMGVAGYIQPVRVLVELPAGSRATSAASLRGLRHLSDSFRADPRVREVRSIVDIERGQSLLALSVLYSDLAEARARYGQFIDAYLSADGRVALMDVIMTDTTSLTTAMALVKTVRAKADPLPKQLRGSTLQVGGYVAAAVDFQDDLLEDFPYIVLMILAATAVMLAIAFRSVLIPVKAVILNTLSVAATFGLITLVFQHGVGGRLLGLSGPTSAIFVVVPVLVFAVVFGLSMDYEVFLLSRIKEAYDRTGDNDGATMEGVSATASVITSAALIMILVFGVFAFARVLVMQFIGFGLAVAVLLDATVIRMVLVPAFMWLAGRWNWWPGGRGGGGGLPH